MASIGTSQVLWLAIPETGIGVGYLLIFIKECPWDQYPWKEGEGNWIEQREKLNCYDEVLMAKLAPQRALKHNGLSLSQFSRVEPK